MENLPSSWISRINIINMAILPKAIYMFNAVPSNIPMIFIRKIEKSTLKFIWKHKTQKSTTSQGNNEQKRNTGGITIPDFKLQYRVIAIKAVWYWHKNR
jgi:hypothetical protein